ncbi:MULTISPECIES: SDR family NAD(P)-dependent oxidoreductase [unclassified Mycolicibacterium]|uniref:SDR family NAD(P)-dependent oxidoreductase n=1 Tax=unclassified Mycolicibacterium TaxID=2636767 RepID=UPI0012DF0179|nr:MULTISPECIES: SDR family NAD(P)-dependent oxidoreductase [unclassified Mycolicibacterium]MUL80783.1 SDR family oxidoreductase [Mycolicibacterium sp. CBMA 329]MUL86550.1 SDR family oxidoreductase [Mycolicibacterium sp. CBMA 331]MUM01411.1 SDR family oxidoreductase [Mycolicibacterium sp. CBMA 334]MUM25920.1 SDR family oxidoreductase [Mycolicibacterium sp. CBMA 295]MUM36846.1 SDR family oxidoreductase [Mycolicibacterium sp. CBMA 247]
MTQAITPQQGRFSAPLDRKVVIVTGAARGIGRGITAALLERGASVLLVDVLGDALAETTESFRASGYPAAPLVADLLDPDSARIIVETAVSRFGAVHGLVNNAMASREPQPFTDISADDYQLSFDSGPRATFLLMQAVYPLFVGNGGGAIVNFGSGSGTAGLPNFGSYAAAKEAVRGMSKVAALEWGADNIRVNVVCPLAASDGVAEWKEAAPSEYQRIVNSVPLRRLGDPHTDIGTVVAFLLSDDASYLTAQTLHVDGGGGSFR